MAERKSYRFGPFLVDCRSACLRRDGVVVPLRPKTFDALADLAQHPGLLVPKSELIDNVWQNLNVTPNSPVQCIKEIRQALRDDTQTIIETIAKRGYLFALPVSRGRRRRRAPARGHPMKPARCHCPIVPPSRCCRSTT